MADDDLEREIADFLRRNVLPLDHPEPLSRDLDLFEAGLVDSLAAVQIGDLLERLLGREIPGRDLTPQNVGSLARLVEYVRAHRA